MPSSFQFESINLNDVQIGGHFQLLRDGEYLDRQNQIWRNAGVLKSDESPVNVIFFGPDCDQNLAQQILRRAKTDRYAIGFSVNSSGTIILNEVPVQYAIIKPGIELARAIIEKKEPASKTPSRKRGFTFIYTLLIVCCITAVAILGLPKMVDFFQATPTPSLTPTSTPTPTPTLTLTPTPTPTLTPTLSEALVYSDDFSDQQISISKWNSTAGSWTVVDGKYFCVTEKNHCLTLATNISADSFTVAVDTLGKEGVDKSIYFGFVDQRYYRVSIRSAPINQILVSEIAPDLPEKLLTQAAFDSVSQKWYHIRVTIQQRSITIYIDNVLIFSAKDLEIENANGFIGLGVEPIQDGISTVNSAEFDNFELLIIK